MCQTAMPCAEALLISAQTGVTCGLGVSDGHHPAAGGGLPFCAKVPLCALKDD